jgi:hypothetical protein
VLAARQLPPGTSAAPEPELGPEGSAVDAALEAWGRNASDILLAVLAVAHLQKHTRWYFSHPTHNG